MEEMTLASEMLAEIKRTSKRWFVAFLVVVGLWFATIGGFLWYISLPVEDTITAEQESDNGSTNQIVGGNIYGSETENYKNN